MKWKLVPTPEETRFPPKSSVEILACLAQHDWRIVDDDGLYELRRLGCHVSKIEVDEMVSDGLIESSPNGRSYRITDAARARLALNEKPMETPEFLEDVGVCSECRTIAGFHDSNCSRGHKMKVYLCGPINGCTDAECKDWRAAVKAALPDFICVDPMKRDYRGKEKASYREIVELDKRDVRSADVVLVNLAKISAGTISELNFAWGIGTPTVLWCKAEDEPTLSPWLRYHATAIVHSLPEAIAKVQEIA